MKSGGNDEKWDVTIFSLIWDCTLVKNHAVMVSSFASYWVDT